jgi:hypothetical protein
LTVLKRGSLQRKILGIYCGRFDGRNSNIEKNEIAVRF